MSSTVRTELEDYLKKLDYRHVELPYGHVWVPAGHAADWPHEGARCVTVTARLPRRSAPGVASSRYAVAVCAYHHASDSGRYWGSEDLVADGLLSADAAACEAMAWAVRRALPVCLEAPVAWHALGAAAFWPVEEDY